MGRNLVCTFGFAKTFMGEIGITIQTGKEKDWKKRTLANTIQNLEQFQKILKVEADENEKTKLWM